MKRPHVLHRWHVVRVYWNAHKPFTVARAVCLQRGCPSTRDVNYPGVNASVEAVRPSFPKRSFKASKGSFNDPDF